jgi:hypothetical protein
MAYNPATKRIQQIKEALHRVDHFEVAATQCLEALESNSDNAFCCKEVAAMKRASMDLTRALPCLRRSA